jgi:uncharacterized membrane protein YkgB
MSYTANITVSRRSIVFLRVSIGIIYTWFGALKFFHGYSPAEALAINTINKLTYNLVPQPANIILLAGWECAVGILLIAGRWLRPALVFLFLHMACTFTPLLFFPGESFRYPPYGFTLVGQYIMKNIIIICAAVVVWPSKKTKTIYVD